VSNGEVWQIAHDVDVGGGAIAFTRGEQVTIYSTVPNEERPEYRHFVFSRVMGQWYQLRDEDLEAPQPAGTPQHFAPGDAFQQGVIAPGQPGSYSSPGDAFGQPARFGIPADAFGPSYGAAQAARVPQTRTRSMSGKDEKRVMWFSGAVTALGVLIVITTFLPWLQIMGFQLGSGWNAMMHGSSGNGFSLFIHGEGVLFFTGFWSILVGLAVITGGVMLFMRYTAGSWVARIAGGAGVICSAMTIITIVTHSLSAGAGLWLFNLVSLATVIVSVWSIRAFR
jgi:hypothetical protein